PSMKAGSGLTRKPSISTSGGMSPSRMSPRRKVSLAVSVPKGTITGSSKARRQSSSSPYPIAVATKVPSTSMLMTPATTLPGFPCSSNEAAASYGIALPVSFLARAAPAARNRIAAGITAMSSLRAPPRLLDVAHHVAVEHDPHVERAVDLLDFGQLVLVGDFDLHAEVLLLVDVDRLGEAEGR